MPIAIFFLFLCAFLLLTLTSGSKRQYFYQYSQFPQNMLHFFYEDRSVSSILTKKVIHTLLHSCTVTVGKVCSSLFIIPCILQSKLNTFFICLPSYGVKVCHLSCDNRMKHVLRRIICIVSIQKACHTWKMAVSALGIYLKMEMVRVKRLHTAFYSNRI